MHDLTAKHLSTLHTALYRLTKGRLGKRLVNNDMLLLTTVGRVTGKPHTVPLLYLNSGGVLVVIASWGGRDRHPEWYSNLIDNPVADVQIEGHRFSIRASVADPEQRARLWPQVLAAYDGYREYQNKTDREIPIVLLSGSTIQPPTEAAGRLKQSERLIRRTRRASPRRHLHGAAERESRPRPSRHRSTLPPT